MTILSIEGGQGSPAWLARRAERLPDGMPARWHASDAPAMMGVDGAHETRSQLLARLHSGIEKEFSDFVNERVIDPGHDFEARARPLAELLLEDDLSPVLVEEGRFSTSLDGRTLDGFHFEHKRLRAELRELLPDIGAAISGPEVGRTLPLAHRIQIAHQHLADPDCQRTLFGATEWDGDVLIGQRWCWVERDEFLCQKVAVSWGQFERDLRAYVPQDAPPVIVPAAQEHLPAVSVQVSGSLTVFNNLADLKPKLAEFISRITKAPSTDQEFADVGAAGKRLREVQSAVENAVNGALASIADVNELQRVGKELAEMARQAAIACEKAHSSGKEAVKQREVALRHASLAEHIASANARLGGAYIAGPQSGNFGAAIKGLSSLDSLRDKLDTELARAKIECSELEAKIAANLSAIASSGPEFKGLFSDRAQLVLKDTEAVAAIVAGRLAEHRAAEEKRLEAERARIRAEEETRAMRAAQEAKEASERAQASTIPAPAPAAAAPYAQESGCSPGTPGMLTGNGATAAAAPPSGSEGGSAQADLSALPPVKLSDICDRLGWRMTAAELSAIGVPTHKVKVTVFVSGSDVAALRAALLQRVQRL